MLMWDELNPYKWPKFVSSKVAPRKEHEIPAGYHTGVQSRRQNRIHNHFIFSISSVHGLGTSVLIALTLYELSALLNISDKTPKLYQSIALTHFKPSPHYMACTTIRSQLSRGLAHLAL